MKLLLASGSPRRRELVSLLGWPIEVTVSDIDERPLPGERPDELALRLSVRKAAAVPSEDRRWGGSQRLVLACDTVVALEGQVLGKPSDAADAVRMLCALRGRSHLVHTAITLREMGVERRVSDLASTRVTMRTYSDQELAAYVDSGDPLDKAGAYAIQHAGFHPVARFEGCYLNVVGLPLCHVVRSLRCWDRYPWRDVPRACQASTGRVCVIYERLLAGRPSPLADCPNV